MGKNPWEDPDHEVAALAASMRGQGGSKRWGRVALGLLVVALLTFVAGYYVPLLRAHDALREQFQQLSERRRALDDSLQNKEREVKKLGEEKAGLQRELDAVAASAKERTDQLEGLRSKVAAKLGAFESKGLAASSAQADRVRVALSTRLLFGATSLTIPSKANAMLCSIAEAAPQAKLRVVAVTADDEPPNAALAAKYGSRRELSAARAAVVGDRLEEACNVKADRLETVGWLENGKDKAWGLKPPAVVVEVVPAK